MIVFRGAGDIRDYTRAVLKVYEKKGVREGLAIPKPIEVAQGLSRAAIDALQTVDIYEFFE